MFRKIIFFLFFVFLHAAFVSGCAVLTPINPPKLSNPSAREPEQLRMGETGSDETVVLTPRWHDYNGVMHVHTTYSHDAHGQFEHVVEVGQQQHLDFVAVTDHNTLAPLREGRGGRYGDLLVLIGMEISAQGGHYLTLNVKSEVDRENLTTQEVIDAIAAQGGLGFIAHPYFKKRRWTDWSVRGFTGMEIYNAAHDTFDENFTRLAFWTLSASPVSLYLSLVDRPYDPLRTWDELIRRHGRVVGIGSVDAHEVHAFGVRFAPYEAMFAMARTHVIAPESPLTPEVVYSALASGHAYVSLDMVAETRGFLFSVEKDGEQLGIMGDELMWKPGMELLVYAPAQATVGLYRDGDLVEEKEGANLRWKADRPGVYRVELERGKKPWIYSNPIYLRVGSEKPSGAGSDSGSGW